MADFIRQIKFVKDFLRLYRRSSDSYRIHKFYSSRFLMDRDFFLFTIMHNETRHEFHKLH